MLNGQKYTFTVFFSFATYTITVPLNLAKSQICALAFVNKIDNNLTVTL